MIKKSEPLNKIVTDYGDKVEIIINKLKKSNLKNNFKNIKIKYQKINNKKYFLKTFSRILKNQLNLHFLKTIFKSPKLKKNLYKFMTYFYIKGKFEVFYLNLNFIYF